MKNYTDLYGFEFIRATDCPEQSGALVEYRHKKTLAPLYYFDRPDRNMTFAIGFRTVPTDDTGVFHILEHSVLCGSKKYPVKDPFTELIKGSITSFINAFTYGERTVYPVSSPNKRAFLDLVSVYLDAVFHPLATESPLVFMQEGHRIEFSEDGKPRRNGIVYNEMRGAYSSPDELAAYHEGRLVFPNGCFGYDSGGNPDAIPSLSYEDFCAAHKRYYHPTNSIIVLDGEVELDRVLKLIDSYLAEFDVGECFDEIPEGDGIVTEPLTVEYPVATEAEERNATRISLIRRCGSHGDREHFQMIALAAEAIAASNSAPLKRKILESGMCTNFSFYPVTGMKYPTFQTTFTDVKDGREEELVSLYRRTLDEILTEGISRDSLLAALNSTEFSTRESDFGSYPRGMVYMSAIMEDVVCKEEPSSSLKYNELFTSLREKLDTPLYVEAMRELFASDEEAMLIMRPSASVEAEKAKAEETELARIVSKMSAEERDGIARANELLEAWQSTPDTEEAVASIPALTIEDLSDRPYRMPTETYHERGVEVIVHDVPCDGITYLDLFFDVSDLSVRDMQTLTVLCSAIADFDTQGRTSGEFRDVAKTNIGSLSMRPTAVKRDGEGRLYLQVSASMLDTNKSAALDVLREFIYERRFDDEARLATRISQSLKLRRESLPRVATSLCIMRAAASFDVLEALKEIYVGSSFVSALAEFDKGDKGELLRSFERLIGSYLTRSRLTVAITGIRDDGLAEKVISLVKEGGTVADKCRVTPLERRNTGIAITSQVSFTARISNLYTEGEGRFNGGMSVLQSILEFEVLWNEIRVKGGAYGTAFLCRATSGTLGYQSFRDPNPERSVRVYKGALAAVRDFLAGKPDLTKYVIGTVGPMLAPSSMRAESDSANLNYLSGITHDDLLGYIDDSIAVTHEDLDRFVDLFAEADKKAVVVVAGPREKLEAMGLDEIIEL